MKTVVVSLEHNFYEYEGRIYSDLAFFYSYWKRYLRVFGEVRVFARVRSVSQKGKNFQRADGPSVNFISAKPYHGISGFLRASFPNVFSAFRVARSNDRFILRSGNVSNLLWLAIFILRKPYLREFPGNILLGTIGVKGKSWQIVAASHVLHKLAKFQAHFAKANGFVSVDCREIYGSRLVPSYVFTSFSADEVNVRKWFGPSQGTAPVTLAVLSRLEAEKNIEFLLRVLGRQPQGVLRLSIIGQGSQMERLQDVAESVGVDVIFHGAVTDRHKLFEMLTQCDLYILPSTTEGTPRSLLEAMTIGIPALASRVGGIPDILPEEYVFSPQDPDELTHKIVKFIESPTSAKIARSKLMKDIIHSKFLDEAQENIMHEYWRKLP